MPSFTIIDAPSTLGLWPSGVEALGIALKSAGLATRLGADYGGRIPPLPFVDERDERTQLRNGEAIRTYSQQLAAVVTKAVENKQIPIVLGGDCSILIGAMLGLKRLGRYGLFFIDGHADFYQPEADPKGEVASMEIGIITGRGPDLLTDIDGLKPLVREEDVVVFGYRDQALALEEGSRDIRETSIRNYTLEQVRQPNVIEVAQAALLSLRDTLEGIWIHLDADVLDDAIMPAVDYRIPGGLGFEELTQTLQVLFGTGRIVGMTITIFNPTLDKDGRLAQQFVEALVKGLTHQTS